MGTENEAREMELPAELVIRTVAEAKEELCAVLDGGATQVSLRAADLVRVDTAGAQLLYAFCREAEQRGIVVQWLEPSEAVTDAAKAMGWDGAFAQP